MKVTRRQISLLVKEAMEPSSSTSLTKSEFYEITPILLELAPLMAIGRAVAGAARVGAKAMGQMAKASTRVAKNMAKNTAKDLAKEKVNDEIDAKIRKAQKALDDEMESI